MSKNGMYRGDAVNDYSTAHETTPESAGQEPAAWMHKQGDFLEPSLRRLDSYELSRGWTQEPLFYAAPIGDNGALYTMDQMRDYAAAFHKSRMEAQPAESKREDFEADAKRLALELECLLLSCKDQAAVSKWWDSAMEALEQHRALLARASAKGE